MVLQPLLAKLVHQCTVGLLRSTNQQVVDQQQLSSGSDTARLEAAEPLAALAASNPAGADAALLQTAAETAVKLLDSNVKRVLQWALTAAVYIASPGMAVWRPKL